MQNRASRKGSFLTLLAVLAVFLVPMASPKAHGLTLDSTTVKRVINMVGLQNALVSQICADLAMVAAGQDVPTRRDRLVQARRLMNRTIKGLRSGDLQLGLPITKKADLVERIDRLEAEWAALDSLVEDALAGKEVTDSQVTRAVELRHRLDPVIKQVAEGYVRDPSFGLFSMYAHTLRASADKRVLGQRMFNQFVLAALAGEGAAHRQALGQSMADFELLLRGLIQGNPQARLLPAPTPEIAAKLGEVSDLWREVRPYLEAAATGKALDAETLRNVIVLNDRFFSTSDQVVTLYEAL